MTKRPWLPDSAVPLDDPRVAIDVEDVDYAQKVFDHTITEEEDGYYYARRAQPNCEYLARILCRIQNARRGVTTPSGMAAAAAVVHTFLARSPGSEAQWSVIISAGVYYEIDMLLRSRARSFGYRLECIQDYTDLTALALRLKQLEAEGEVVPESWTGRIVNPNSEERSQCPRSDVSTVPI